MPRPKSILTVLTAQELRDFLPGTLLERVRALTDDYQHLDATPLTPAGLHQELIARRPEVVIGGWKTPPLPPVLPPELRYFCYLTGSVKKVVSLAHLQAGLVVTNWGGSISRIVAEWALFHTLSCLRRATHWTLAMHREGAWKDNRTETASLFNRRVGLHGFGMVARELVRLLRPFDVSISAFAPDVDAQAEAEFGVRRAASLEALFAENDIVIELAPLIAETTGCVTERHLRLLKPGGAFINVGRGAVVDEAAMLRVAEEGEVMFGLDVFTVEPLAANSGFRGLPNVTLTPHLAGPTTDRRVDAGTFSVRNLEAYTRGLPLNAVITPEVYQRIT